MSYHIKTGSILPWVIIKLFIHIFRTPIINHGSGPPSGLPLLTHDKKSAENTALAVIADAGFEYPFDSGLYLFPDEPNLDYDIVEDYKNKSNQIIPNAGESS